MIVGAVAVVEEGFHVMSRAWMQLFQDLRFHQKYSKIITKPFSGGTSEGLQYFTVVAVV